MQDFKEQWQKTLEERFGDISDTRTISSDGKPEITVHYFSDLPEQGTLTAITSGLSNANCPEWKYSKPELIVTLDTKDINWGLAAGYFASAFYEEKLFKFGDVFLLDDPISDESEMSAYLVFMPSILDSETAAFELPDRKIFLSGMYPLYSEEIEIYKTVGVEKFMDFNEFDPYNPKRPCIKSM